VRRAVSNLLSNACRYATPGSLIEVRIARSDVRHVSIGVHNDGPAILAEHLPRLFDRFYRVDPSRTNADRNHGLGLSIVAAIARMHGGTATATSSENGTYICFTLEDPGASDGKDAATSRTSRRVS
jgi:two-component system heavy metal sensor histidine kinase CusS